MECVIYDLDSQPFEVERNIVQTALSELDNVMKMNLVKISNATHFRDKLEDREIKLVEDAFSHNNGKWFFQPDQRSRTETFFIQKDPCIARNVLPFKEWSELNNSTKDKQTKLMKSNNPTVIPRNHKVEEALAEADKGNLDKMKKLLTILKNPYDNQNSIDEYQLPAPSSNEKYQTFCGT